MTEKKLFKQLERKFAKMPLQQNPLIISARAYEQLIESGMINPKKYKKGKWRK